MTSPCPICGDPTHNEPRCPWSEGGALARAGAPE